MGPGSTDSYYFETLNLSSLVQSILSAVARSLLGHASSLEPMRHGGDPDGEKGLKF